MAPITAQQWKNSGLVPTRGLAAWHMYEAGFSNHNYIADYSGNGRDLTSSPTNSAVLTAGAGPNNTPAWYFNGTTTVPLKWTGAINPKHVFLLGSFDESAFTQYRGLLTGPASGSVFVSDSSGTKFFNVGHGSQTMLKNGTEYTEALAEAPVGGAFALVEARRSGGIALDGLQIGQQNADTTRRHKGYFSEQLVYSEDLTAAEIARVCLYFNVKAALWRLGLPFRFPSDDFMPVRRRRFKAERVDYSKTTDYYEFEDAGRTFNEVSETPPRRWEYEYRLINPDGSTDPPLTVVFDAFNDQARMANPFDFTDKYGVTWDSVRIESYDRDHRDHMPWKQTIKFRLVRYP